MVELGSIKRLTPRLVFVAIFVVSFTSVKSDDQVEIPFPRMFRPDDYGLMQIRIVSETIGDEVGYQTVEEYLDLQQGKMLLTRRSAAGQTSLLIDAINDYAHKYQPYTCESSEMSAVVTSGLDGLRTETKFRDGKTRREHSMHLYGVAGLWTFASELPKVYTYQESIYSAASDAFRMSHNWTVINERKKLKISLNFVDTKRTISTSPDLALSLIQIRSLDTSKLLRTINILELEYLNLDGNHNDLLQIPVGYGCSAPIGEKEQYDFLTGQEDDSFDGQKLDIEISATKFDSSLVSDNSNQMRRNSDIVSVDLAYGTANKKKTEMQLIRYRDSKTDTKHVINHALNVDYLIDLKRGTCQMKHSKLKQNEYEPTVVKFANGLSLTLDVTMMNELFFTRKGLNFVRKMGDLEFFERKYYESNLIEFNGNSARLMRLYSASNLLESVTMWVLDTSKTKLIEVYHINVVSMIKLTDIAAHARVFDVSEQCYLDNKQMRSGKDYAWLEFTYPVFGRYINQLAERHHQLREIFYSRWVEDFYRVPRVEFVFDDSSFILRVLEIELPPVSIIYEPMPGKQLEPSQGDLDELAPDLEHCSDWCRLHQCQTMSFCESGRCILSSRRPEATSTGKQALKFIEASACISYAVPADRTDLGELGSETLQHEIAELQGIDYSTVTLPQPPEELVYPRSETGIDQETYDKLTRDYERRLRETVSENEASMPNLILRLELNGQLLIMLPSKFELERDPLNQADLLDSGGSDANEAVVFHQGLGGRRFNYDSFYSQQERSARIFTAFSYEQCQIACLDSKCSSFSYCRHRQECITTNINQLVAAENCGLLEEDTDCFIEQRDFLSNFHKFPNAFRPSSYESTSASSSPSECALNCMSQTEFKCLAFVHCVSANTEQAGECIYLSQRHVSSNAGGLQAGLNANVSSKGPVSTGCNHFSRSYLADFIRLETREFKPTELAKLKSTKLDGHSMFKCADICINELIDCTAFQFCIDTSTKGIMQSCTMIQSKPERGELASIELEVDKSGKILKAGDIFDVSANCHIFAMRSYTSEAQLRDLALDVQVEGDADLIDTQKLPPGGLTLGGTILLYLCTVFVFAAAGGAVCIMKESNAYFRFKVDQIRAIMRI